MYKVVFSKISCYAKKNLLMHTKHQVGGTYMISALNVSNNLINRAKLTGATMTPMKLQKLLYFVYARYLFRSNQPLFKERFATWQFGPVIPEVYKYFESYSRKNIDDYFVDENNEIYGAKETGLFADVLEEVWNKFGQETGIHLSERTHEQGAAWSIADERDHDWLNDVDISKDGRSFFDDLTEQ